MGERMSWKVVSSASSWWNTQPLRAMAMIDVTPSSVSVAAATVASDCFSFAPVERKVARSSARRRAEASAHHASGR